MDWLILSSACFFFIGLSAVFDKVLLKRESSFNPWSYTFWTAFLGIVSLVLVPFGLQLMSGADFLIALVCGLFFDISLFLLFYSLSVGSASGLLSLRISLIPIFTLITSYLFLHDRITIGSLVAFFILIIGSFAFFILEKRENRMLPVLLCIVSAAALGISDTLSKIIFNHNSFVTGFVWIKLSGLLFGFLILLYGPARASLTAEKSKGHAKNSFFYFLNRAVAGVCSLGIYFSISLGHPALVSCVQSVQYIAIFIGSWILLGERSKGKDLFLKILGTIIVAIGLTWLGISSYADSVPVNKNRKIEWGISFSNKFSSEKNGDWKKVYTEILTDLKPANIRIGAYWNDIERENNKYTFEDLDWQVEEASKYNTKLVLVVGMKSPRWPECHIPAWAKSLEMETREKELREYMSLVVERYKNNPNIKTWQVENEPFLKFGDCPIREEGFLQKEVDLVKSIDPTRPTLITDGGEFGDWVRALKHGDEFGTTMYRRVYPNIIGPMFGVVEYPLEPSFFILKEAFTRWRAGVPNKKYIVSELQGEPWGPNVTYEDQMRIFSFDYFKGVIDYANKANFDEYYLWGVEWWYDLKVNNNDARFWNEFKRLNEQQYE